MRRYTLVGLISTEAALNDLPAHLFLIYTYILISHLYLKRKKENRKMNLFPVFKSVC